MSAIGEAVLGWLSRAPGETDYAAPAYEAKRRDVEACAAELLGFFPGIGRALAGGRALSIGCAEGMEAVALAHLGASEAHGLDIRVPWPTARAVLARYPQHTVRLWEMDASALRFSTDAFDAVVTSHSFEHFLDPLRVLLEVRRVLRPGGRLFLTSSVWGCPWGAHMTFFTRVPWVQFLFSERTIMSVRSRYRDDGARRFRDIEGGLNKVGVRSFRRLACRSGLVLERMELRPVRGLRRLTHVPVLRELFSNLIIAELSKPAH